MRRWRKSVPAFAAASNGFRAGRQLCFITSGQEVAELRFVKIAKDRIVLVVHGAKVQRGIEAKGF